MTLVHFGQHQGGGGRKKVYLNAGEILFGRGDYEVHTLLGSCIAIVLWHPIEHYCGICHFAMPKHPGHQVAKLDARYGDHCLKIFRQLASQKQTRLEHYQAKIYGGGNMLLRQRPSFPLSGKALEIQQLPVGDINSSIAYQLLLANKVTVDTIDVGEHGYRKIVLDTITGKVDVIFREIQAIPMARQG